MVNLNNIGMKERVSFKEIEAADFAEQVAMLAKVVAKLSVSKLSITLNREMKLKESIALVAKRIALKYLLVLALLALACIWNELL